ncbi:MAG TPA: hypothetical protein VK530_07760 [Candidatus Acidoferrum sp.]|nr:hypothetical protein [Candidatus Acidoferrum sp.]
MSAHQRDDFPASRRLEPNPYEYRVWDDLPPTVALLTTNTPAWIRAAYLNHVSATLQHHSSRYDSLTNVARMYAAIGQLPESREWLRTNEVALARQQVRGRRADSDEPLERYAWTNLLSSLRAMGMSETNLGKLVE